MQQIIPFLWFDQQAEEAARFYTTLFPNSRIVAVNHYGEAGPGPQGSVMTVAFQLNGMDFIALNGGPVFKFSEAISFFVRCESQAEVDWLWANLTAGGEELMCGWLKDRYGVAWQIVPAGLEEMLNDSDPDKARRATEAMLQMKKIDIEKVRQAFEGERE